MTIMKVYPTVTGRPDGEWSADCGLCDSPLKSTYRARWHARKAAASHLWAHRTQGSVVKRPRMLPSRLYSSIVGPPLDVTGPCPRPGVLKHTTLESAQKHVDALARDGQGLSTDVAYPCRCGYYHAGRDPRVPR